MIRTLFTVMSRRTGCLSVRLREMKQSIIHALPSAFRTVDQRGSEPSSPSAPHSEAKTDYLSPFGSSQLGAQLGAAVGDATAYGRYGPVQGRGHSGQGFYGDGA